ncbi:hypothetical protein AVEN_81519-1 [Araneus ventricosus]|uniref:Uncharacterized protein n=1 Tax=Araneus ventricosus TaxID=182803 RepID=A0A4Y2N5V3_ARAVE|nr:hypothetical protein AVEN_23492-1 [Araneus ventricosus]GBO41790.1 hypothetical protein AVEN_81519-1 [Araneus ventricosus]
MPVNAEGLSHFVLETRFADASLKSPRLTTICHVSVTPHLHLYHQLPNVIACEINDSSYYMNDLISLWRCSWSTFEKDGTATRGLFWDEPRNFEPRSDDEDDAWAVTPSPSFHATPKGGRLATTYDLACSRPHTRRIFGGIGSRVPGPGPYL